MFKLPIRTWVCNAAAVFSGPYGAVTEQAVAAQCRRETVYEPARKVEQRLAVPPADNAALAALRAENQRLRQALAACEAKEGCPYQALGLELPTYDSGTLLQSDPEELAQELSTSGNTE